MQDIIQFAQHHPLLSLSLIIVLALLIIIEFIRIRRGASQITPAKATQMINHENAVVIDIRSKDAFKNGHIINAHSMPLTELNENKKKFERFKTKPLIIVCANGLESKRMVDDLIRQGYLTYILAGGIRGWTDADLPLVKG